MVSCSIRVYNEDLYRHANLCKHLISSMCDVPKSQISRIYSSGIEHIVTFTSSDRFYKLTSCRKEYLAAKKLQGKDFKNVVKVFGAHECPAIVDIGDRAYLLSKLYIIDQEKLQKIGRSLEFSWDLSSLAEKLDDRVGAFISVVNGLYELASVGIIHKDLHPYNVMMDTDGNLKIIDFGIVKIANDQENQKKILFIQSRAGT